MVEFSACSILGPGETRLVMLPTLGGLSLGGRDNLPGGGSGGEGTMLSFRLQKGSGAMMEEL